MQKKVTVLLVLLASEREENCLYLQVVGHSLSFAGAVTADDVLHVADGTDDPDHVVHVSVSLVCNIVVNGA